MKKICVYSLLCAGILLLGSLANAADPLVSVSGLTCEQRTNPLGVEAVSPAFGWQIRSGAYEVKQEAWQVQISASREKLLTNAPEWDSGKRDSAEQIGQHLEGCGFQPAREYWWRVKVWTNKGESDWSEPAFFVTGLTEWNAKWITRPWPPEHTLPYFRKTFELTQSAEQLAQATAYICGLGCSELYINGERPDDRFLDPAQSNYESYALYSTLDILPRLRDGANCVGVMLGDGWYNQDRVWGKGPFSYGEPLFITQLVLRYKDGSTQIVVSDEDWQWHEGPVLDSNIYAGEIYDANKEVKDWCSGMASSEGWEKAVLAANHPSLLISQMMEPMRPVEVRKPVCIKKSKDGNWIFDFGENITGFPEICAEQPTGTRWVMKMSEDLDKNGEMDYTSTGVFATGCIQKDEYIFKGEGVEKWRPRFTYHGFRYLELSGCDVQPKSEWIIAHTMHSDVKVRGHFECSDPQINRLHKMALRTMLNNFQGIPTDCPHRERCGWLGDTHAYVRAANLNFGMQSFWNKYLFDIHSCADKQIPMEIFHNLGNTNFYFSPKPSGIPFMIAPGKRLCGAASPDWGTAVTQLPWYGYVYFGDKELLARFYPDMKNWVDYISIIAEDGIITKGLGDWCPPEGNEAIDCPIALSSTAFHYLDLALIAETAKILGYDKDAVFYRTQRDFIKNKIIEKFYDKENATFGSQTADSLALDMGFFPNGEEFKISDSIVKNINEKYSGFMHCGVFGLARLGHALSDYGNAEQAWKVFTKTGTPSFEAMWKIWDATTLWEVLPIWEKDYIGNASKDHPMQAGYDAWFYEAVAGIRPDAAAPGFRHIRFCPQVCDYLDWAFASVETAYGLTSIRWEKSKKGLTYHIMVPPNTTASVDIPAGKRVTMNGKTLNSQQTQCVIGSGEYTFVITPAEAESGKDAFVACYYFPNYHPSDARNNKYKGEGWSEWEVVKASKPRYEGHYQPRVPLWGYTDESDPKVMVRKIDAAVDHGIDAFIFDWYYYDDGLFLERGLEQGFMKAPNANRLKFALMWANHDWLDIHPWKYSNPWEWKLLYPGKVSPETFDKMCDYIIETYFKHPSYWLIEGKPYFSVYELSKLMESFGSLQATREAMDRFREKTKAAGFPGLHLNAVVWGQPVLPQERGVADPVQLMRDLDFDSVTSYVWVHHGGLKDFPATDYNYVRDEYMKYWDKAEKEYNIPYYPNVTVGWDGFPRSHPDDPLQESNPFQRAMSGNTPERLKEVVKMTRDRLKKRPASERIFNINCWNEWTEGSYLEPDTRYNMEYLEAVRDGK